MRSSSRRAASRGSGSAVEIGHRFDPGEVLPEAGQGALALQVRAGEEELVAHVDHAETRRRVEAERRCVAAVGGGCLAPVAAHHDGSTLTALVADDDGRWIERRTGDDPEALGRLLADAQSSSRGREAHAGELARRLEAHGHDVAVCPLIEIEPLGDEPIELAGYDWVVVTSRTAAELLAASCGRCVACRCGDRAGNRRARCASSAASRRSCRPCRRRKVSSPSFRDRPAVCSSQAQREPAATRPRAGRRLRTALPDREAVPAAPPDGDLVVLASASAARAFARLDADIPAVSIGPETTKAARAAGVRVAAEAETHDLDGLVAAVESACSSLS